MGHYYSSHYSDSLDLGFRSKSQTYLGLGRIRNDKRQEDHRHVKSSHYESECNFQSPIEKQSDERHLRLERTCLNKWKEMVLCETFLTIMP